MDRPGTKSSPTAITIRNARKGFFRNSGESLNVLNGIDLDVAAGEFLAILGPSGCGKSTLLNVLARVEVLDSGRVEYNLDAENGAKGKIAAVSLNGFADYYPSALDPYTKRQIEKEVVRLWESLDTTIILVTHDVQKAVALADRIVVLTARPATVKSMRDNPLPRPRDLDALYGQTEFHEIVRELWLHLTEGHN